MAKILRKNKLNLYQVIFSFCKVYYLKTDYARFRGLPIRLLFHRKVFGTNLDLQYTCLDIDCAGIISFCLTQTKDALIPLYILQKRNDHQHFIKQTQTDRLLMVDFAN